LEERVIERQGCLEAQHAELAPCEVAAAKRDPGQERCEAGQGLHSERSEAVQPPLPGSGPGRALAGGARVDTERGAAGGEVPDDALQRLCEGSAVRGHATLRARAGARWAPRGLRAEGARTASDARRRARAAR